MTATVTETTIEVSTVLPEISITVIIILADLGAEVGAEDMTTEIEVEINTGA